MSAVERRIPARDGLLLAALDWDGDPARTPLLCLTGLCRTARDYEDLAGRQAGTRRVVALDYMGHGGSARAPDVSRYRPERVVEDILDACAALHLPRAVLVGTSFGGLMTMFLSVVRPSLVRGAVLNDIGPRIESEGLALVEEFAGSDPGFAALEDAVPYIRRYLPRIPLRDEAAWLRFAELTYARGEDGRYHPRWDTRIVQTMRAGAARDDFGPVFRGLRAVPVALVWAERSEILGAATVRAMVRDKPDLEVIALPEAGHAPTLDEPEVAPRLDAFLGGIP